MALRSPHDRPRLLLAMACCLAQGWLWRPLAAGAQEVTGDEVRVSIEAAKGFLLGTKHDDGTWPEYRFDGGTTALSTLALLNAGLKPDNPQMQAAVAACARIPLRHTYVVCLKTQALAAANPTAYRAQIQAAADWLVAAQHSSGMWGYDAGRGSTDFSNSQFALLGLHEAAKAGARIPVSVWRKAEKSWQDAQNTDGGWAYTPNQQHSTGSMTAAGVASLYICGESLTTQRERGFTPDGVAPNCGKRALYRPIARGLQWLGTQFSVERNPGSGAWLYYYLYGLERVGILSGLEHFGKHDWYREGAARLVRLQTGNGAWREVNPVVDTAFGLLFLAKGYRPVLFHKLAWSSDNRWCNDPHDLEHLTGFIGDRIGGQTVSWSTVAVDDPIEMWMAAPILYLTGHEFPKLSDPQREQLKRYVDLGGTILAEACCGREDFRRGFDEFAKKTFPEFDVRRLTADHAVFRTLFDLNGSAIILYGMDIGCRTSVFFSPVDLSCLWEQGDIPVKSEAAFKLGANIAAYATGAMPLPDKLDAARLVRATEAAASQASPPRGALHFAQLMHNGDWRPFPKTILNLADHLHRHLGVDVVRHYVPLRSTEPEFARHPIVYMTGSTSFSLSAEEVAALKEHLERGGLLLADACCGHKPFDSSFRELVKQLFPGQPLERLTADHPILSGSPGVPIGEVRYFTAVQEQHPDLKQPWLEGVTLEGRTVLVYSRFGLGSGISDSTCFGCLGVAPDDALRIAGNIVLYGLSH
ncbi:MAG: DUF4159 domain-containing protein [Phycisphaerae bacterium]|nr:DUF4159 domain-containing protein [Phycisphaerae bacterium]